MAADTRILCGRRYDDQSRIFSHEIRHHVEMSMQPVIPKFEVCTGKAMGRCSLSTADSPRGRVSLGSVKAEINLLRREISFTEKS